MKINVMWQR